VMMVVNVTDTNVTMLGRKTVRTSMWRRRVGSRWRRRVGSSKRRTDSDGSKWKRRERRPGRTVDER
jgi:hypothetical protein